MKILHCEIFTQLREKLPMVGYTMADKIPQAGGWITSMKRRRKVVFKYITCSHGMPLVASIHWDLQ
jgi:hypothetical protein